MKPIIQCNDLTYAPPSGGESTQVHGEGIQSQKPILRNLSLTIQEGEFLALIGANGSGKTTLARHFNALLIPTSGQLLVEGMDTRVREYTAEIRRLVGMVMQFPEDQMVAEHVEAEIAFGVENLGLARQEIYERVNASLKVVDMESYCQRPTFTLSAGQMQRIAIAGILAVKPRVIIFDESTAMLDPSGRKAVMAVIQHLHREGITVILITHMMEEAASAERIVVLSYGEIVMDDTPAHVFSDEKTLAACRLSLPPAAKLAKAIRLFLPGLPADLLTTDSLVGGMAPLLGDKIPSVHPGDIPKHDLVKSTDDWMIAAQGIDHTYLEDTPLAFSALKNVSLHVRKGCIQGLAGATGSGKSTLLQHLNGLILPQEGSLRVAGFDLSIEKPDLKALRRRVGLAFQLPEMYFFEQYVGDEIAYGLKQLGVSERSELRAKVERGMKNAGLDFDAFVNRLTFTLSSGEKRKVALACALALEPELLLLDEPTAGLDPAAHIELIEKLKTYRSLGMTILLSSHQIEDLAVLAETVCILAGGQVILSGDVREVFTRFDELSKAGLEMPIAARVAHSLRSRGISLPTGVITGEDLVNHLRSIIDRQSVSGRLRGS